MNSSVTIGKAQKSLIYILLFLNSFARKETDFVAGNDGASNHKVPLTSRNMLSYCRHRFNRSGPYLFAQAAFTVAPGFTTSFGHSLPSNCTALSYYVVTEVRSFRNDVDYYRVRPHCRGNRAKLPLVYRIGTGDCALHIDMPHNLEFSFRFLIEDLHLLRICGRIVFPRNFASRRSYTTGKRYNRNQRNR